MGKTFDTETNMKHTEVENDKKLCVFTVLISHFTLL